MAENKEKQVFDKFKEIIEQTQYALQLPQDQKVLDNWREFIQNSTDLLQEGQKKFVTAAKNYCDSMQYFSELTGNIPLSGVYKVLSENIDKIKNIVNKD